MNLTQTERLILRNQYEILKKIDPENADYYNEITEILENGYSGYYNYLFKGLSPDIDKSECDFVVEVLDMYRAIEDYKRGNPTDSEVVNDPFSHFAGFDGNTEAECHCFAQFLIKVQKKWQEQIPYEHRTDGYNSHMPVKDIYKRMLDVRRSLRKPFPLSSQQVRAILQAAPHPDAR